MARKFSWMAVVLVVVSLLQGLVVSPSAFAVTAPAPSGFVSGQWLVVAHQAAVGPEFAEFKLAADGKKDWVVVVADVTNTGIDAVFSVKALELGTVDGGNGAAPDQILDVKDFSTTALDAGDTVTIVDSTTVRIAVAYSTSEVSDKEVALILGDQVLPLSRTIVDEFDAKTLGTPEPLTIAQVTVQDAQGSGEINVINASGVAESVDLAGVTTPDADGCFGAEAAQAVLNLTGGTAWVQDDPSGEGSLVWYWDAAQGGLVLLNETLLDQGFGGFQATKGGTLAPWMYESAADAQDAGLGLWDLCKDARGTWINPPTVEPTPRPTKVPPPSAEQIRADYQYIDARDLLIRPGTFEGKKIVVSGSVFNIQVEGDFTFMQIWVDGGNYDAVMIGYQGDSSGIYEGTYVTVYGVGAGTMSGTNSFGASITQPLIRADIVDF